MHKWWADDQIDDNSFVQGIQFLIKEGIVKIPPTTQGDSWLMKFQHGLKNNTRLVEQKVQ